MIGEKKTLTWIIDLSSEFWLQIVPGLSQGRAGRVVHARVRELRVVIRNGVIAPQLSYPPQSGSRYDETIPAS